MSATHASDETPAETLSDLSDHILGVPGVSTVYPAASPVAQVVSAIGAALTPADADREGIADRVDIAVSDDRIRVRIGVDGVEPAGEVCRTVYAVVRAWADRTGRTGCVVDVTAATIGD
ncbi:hypothetical protein [Leifsonia sp. Le1]|uniref:hypothetical protein n=1 Tax=Leifsonia sp. Le1 TaxID=3404918 RepID=UPI003EB6D36F